ncbi:MAG: amylo-alpha-1,6-glucosidase [Lentisphaeria bacterium]
MEIRFHRDQCRELREACGREWLDTNGVGGYASGTICNCHTRKYHGLLAANLAQPPGTFLLLSHFEDWLEAGGERHYLVTHQYGDAVSPDGYLRQELFEQGLCPRFRYQCGAFTVSRRVMMVQGRNQVLVRYDLEDGPPEEGAELWLRPLLAYRNIHAVAAANPKLDGRTVPLGDGFSITPYSGLPSLCVQAQPAPAFTAQPCWYYRFHYEADAERGFEHHEDLYTPGVLRVPLKPGRPVIVSAGLEPVRDPALVWEQEEERRRLRQQAVDREAADIASEPAQRLHASLHRAATQFLINLPGDGPALHAGYHWFGPWGRDTLIALPGLTFHGGDLEQGARILKNVARLERHGLLPNFLNPDGTGAYTAADPSLWFFWCVQQYLASGGNVETVRRDYWPAMLAIIRHFQEGTHNGIQVDGTGLVRAGTPSTAVTWMDAQVGGRPIIPRWGYMVEINALWYNAVSFALDLSRRVFQECVETLDADYGTRIQCAFQRKFWIKEENWLYDTVNEAGNDNAVRPNQLLAVSLPFSPLTKEQQKAVVRRCRDELFTPFGLRSLSAEDLRYRGICQGENWVRELAYHQGSVWPWLLCHFAEALFKAEGRTAKNRALFNPVIIAFDKHLHDAGVGSVSEVFDGDAPHLPRGAISQAWNVAGLLRLLHVLQA